MTNQWWLEPPTFKQIEALAKHQHLSKEEALLIYPTKGEAKAALHASIFAQILDQVIDMVQAGSLKTKQQVYGYFVDESDGGENHLGNTKFDDVWDFVKKYFPVWEYKKTAPPTPPDDLDE